MKTKWARLACMMVAVAVSNVQPGRIQAAEKVDSAPSKGSSATDKGISGRWAGTFTVAQGEAALEITFFRKGTKWKGAGTLKVSSEPGGPHNFTTRDIELKGNEVSFNAEIKGADVRFKGKPQTCECLDSPLRKSQTAHPMSDSG